MATVSEDKSAVSGVTVGANVPKGVARKYKNVRSSWKRDSTVTSGNHVHVAVHHVDNGIGWVGKLETHPDALVECNLLAKPLSTTTTTRTWDDDRVQGKPMSNFL